MRSILPRSPKSPMGLKPSILRTGKPHLHFGARFRCEEHLGFLLGCFLNVAPSQALKPAECACPGIEYKND
ncbi:hypothetical protein M0657_011914 [Pyricularia oryzae]|uniref:Uncharacterized protein n=1 Tax=Pyricularia oryzae (strain Y34) TaxID=1143189 RepID=A0AA97NLK5_PYRO3|nr:hypothetical protein OOU_Y34scaffold01176g4 [Pyricularia oryzae Y34]KAI7908792.1 hypothetical protein M9X92_011994 [Pyricularia oryzae]KAI7909280.1 hypothetical protein M0657_011914 [Pyricularia oryzae]